MRKTALERVEGRASWDLMGSRVCCQKCRPTLRPHLYTEVEHIRARREVLIRIKVTDRLAGIIGIGEGTHRVIPPLPRPRARVARLGSHGSSGIVLVVAGDVDGLMVESKKGRR